VNNDQQDTINRLQIELHVPDFDTALEFYGKLGFKKVWMRQEHNGGDYLIMEHGGTILNFWPGNDAVWDQPYFKNFPKGTKRGYGIEIAIPVDDVEASYQQVKQFAHISSALKMQPWGVKDFRIEDPFGFYLRITERHNILDPKYAVPTEKV
jgi:uncharacterized glyoxalase superfamily protein PhnB